jgi:hypothetical protein
MSWRKDIDEDRRRELERESQERLRRRLERRGETEGRVRKLDTRPPTPLTFDELDARIRQ